MNKKIVKFVTIELSIQFQTPVFRFVQKVGASLRGMWLLSEK